MAIPRAQVYVPVTESLTLSLHVPEQWRIQGGGGGGGGSKGSKDPPPRPDQL